MGSRPRSFVGIIRRTRRGPNSHKRRRHCNKAENISRRIRASSTSSTVPDKLEALKNLIPSHTDGGGGGEIKTDQLFQETADYIVLLRTQILVLQKLVDFYGSDADATAAAQQNQAKLHSSTT